MSQDVPPAPHRPYEDAMAMVLGTLMVALGLSFYTTAKLATGGTAGIALLLHFATGWSVGAVFFLLNLPFYALSIWRMGWSFTVRTFIAVSLLSVFVPMTGQCLQLVVLQPIYAAVMGGSLVGLGMLILFRHKAGLGGFNTLALFLQQRYGLRAGYVMLALDVVILIVAIMLLPLDSVALSLVGAAAMNLVLAVNHRPGRYVGIS
jgi:uncharacterized membrane-anchored protein YitT (DUF2179 family)